jgi:branched-chain amino acid transport system substrate-binding protein
MISPASSHKDLPDKGKFIFRTIPSDNLQTVVFARYLARVEKIKSLGILHLNNDYSRTNAMDFKTEYEKNGGRITVLENGNQGDKDFIQQLKRIKAAKPEAIYLPTFTVETAVILEQLKQIGLKVKIFSSSTFANPIIFDLAGDTADGVIFVQASEQPSGKNRKIFESKYYEKWGKKPEAASLDDVTRFYDGTYNWGMKPDLYSLRAYDAANIILNAIRVAATKDEAGNVHIDRDKICSIVAATRDYNGVSGKITFTPNGDLSSDTGIFTAKNRKYLQMKVYRLNGDNLMRVK